MQGIPLLSPELSWMLVGEKLSEGGTMYRDVWCQLEPLAAGFYYLIDLVSGRSQVAYFLINLILVFIQAVGFNHILNVGNVFNERTSIPALLYLLFASAFFDFNTLTPILMGTTLLLPAFNLLLLQIRVKEKQENLLMIGIFSGVASLFYLSLSFFLLLVIIVMLLYSHVSLRLYLTLLIGFVFPFLLVGSYYFLLDGLQPLFYNLLAPAFKISMKPLMPLPGIALIALPSVILGLVSLWVISERAKYINFQYQVLKVMGIWIWLGILCLIFVRNLEPFHLLALTPPLAYLGSHYFLTIRNKWMREVPIFALIAIIVYFNFFMERKGTHAYLNSTAMVIPSSGSIKLYSNKRILVIGDDPAAYVNNSLATPYLTWNLALRHFNYLNNYYNLSEVYSNFNKDLPDVIIDQKNIIPKLFYKLPLLEEQYQKSDTVNVYFRKNTPLAEIR